MFLCFLQVRLFNERQWHFALTSSVAILKSGISSYAGISLASFDHQIKPKEVSLLELSKTKSQYSTKRSGLFMFSEIGKLHAKKIISFYSGRGVCSKRAKS